MYYSHCPVLVAAVSLQLLIKIEAYRIHHSDIILCAYFTSNVCIFSYSVMKKIQIDLRGTIFVSRSLALQNTLERLTAKNLAEIISDGHYYLDRNPLIFHHITTTPKVISTSQGIFVPYRHEAKSSFGEFLWQMFHRVAMRLCMVIMNPNSKRSVPSKKK